MGAARKEEHGIIPQAKVVHHSMKVAMLILSARLHVTHPLRESRNFAVVVKFLTRYPVGL